MNLQKNELLRENLASIQHAIWSHWMHYLFAVCEQNQDGSYTIPPNLVERWQRQMNTNYEALSEEEKRSDQEQADKILITLPF